MTEQRHGEPLPLGDDGLPYSKGLMARALYSLVVWLLQRGANPNHQDRSGSTALCRAAYAADVEGVECLLRQGADPNLTDRHGNGPLWEALCGAPTENQLRVLELLLQSGARPDALNIHGVSPRMRAQGHPQAAQVLHKAARLAR